MCWFVQFCLNGNVFTSQVLWAYDSKVLPKFIWKTDSSSPLSRPSQIPYCTVKVLPCIWIMYIFLYHYCCIFIVAPTNHLQPNDQPFTFLVSPKTLNCQVDKVQQPMVLINIGKHSVQGYFPPCFSRLLYELLCSCTVVIQCTFFMNTFTDRKFLIFSVSFS